MMILMLASAPVPATPSTETVDASGVGFVPAVVNASSDDVILLRAADPIPGFVHTFSTEEALCKDYTTDPPGLEPCSVGVAFGQSTPVEFGTLEDKITTKFFCEVHPWMVGVLRFNEE